MNVKNCFVVLFLGIHILSFSQDKKRSKSAYPSKKMDEMSTTESAEYYFEEAQQQQKNTTEALKFIEKGLKIAIDNQDIRAESKAYFTLGNVFLYHAQFDLALENYLLAENKKYQNYFPQDEVLLLENTAVCYEKLLKCAEAYKTRKLIFDKIVSQKNSIQILYQSKKMAFNKWKCKNYKEAILDYQNLFSSSLFTLTNDDKIEINNRIGDIYYEQNNISLAKNYYNKALSLSQKDKKESLDYESTDKLSKIYKKERNYDEAIKLRSSAQNQGAAPSSSADMNQNQVKIAELYIQQNKAEEAIPILENAVVVSKKTGDNASQKDALQNLADAYSKIQQHDKALKYYKKYTALHDSILRNEEQKLNDSIQAFKKLSGQNNQISIFKKDLEINLQTIAALQNQRNLDEANLKKQKILIYSLLLGLAFLLVIIYFIYRSNKLKRLSNQILVLKSLRSQMNPHFIFNSLNAVNHFIIQNKELEANKFIADFSKLMRMVMENSQEDFISLDKEIEIIKMYLKLENQRFEDKFSYEFKINPEIETEAIKIPPMLIQPYIENAIWHGLRYKQEKGYLLVEINEIGNKIRIIIEDNGIGRTKSQEIKTKNQSEHKSTGMKNTQSRLQIMNELFDSNMSVVVSDLHPNFGTHVQIEISKTLK